MVSLIAQQSAGNPRRIKRLLNSFVTEYQLDKEWRDFGADGLMKAVVLQHYYPDLYQSILSSNVDHVDGVLDYWKVRDWLLRGLQLSNEEHAWLGDMLNRHGVPAPVGPAYAEECRKSLAQLDERVHTSWRPLADNEELLALLRDFGDSATRERLQQRMRRRPLSTMPPTESKEKL